MRWFKEHPIRKDSKSIAILAIFTALVLVIEFVKIPGITDIPLDPEGRFTIDATGIFIMIIFLGLGFVYSMVTIAGAWIGIASRNPISASFKAIAELYTVIGLGIAKLIGMRLHVSKKMQVALYLTIGCLFRAAAMYPTNILLLQMLIGLPLEAAIAGSTLYVSLNLIQAAVNIVGGVILFYLIPENLALQAGLGDDADRASERVQELPPDEILISSTDELTTEAHQE